MLIVEASMLIEIFQFRPPSQAVASVEMLMRPCFSQSAMVKQLEIFFKTASRPNQRFGEIFLASLDGDRINKRSRTFQNCDCDR
jgi:hypothetical protein